METNILNLQKTTTQFLYVYRRKMKSFIERLFQNTKRNDSNECLTRTEHILRSLVQSRFLQTVYSYGFFSFFFCCFVFDLFSVFFRISLNIKSEGDVFFCFFSDNYLHILLTFRLSEPALPF